MYETLRVTIGVMCVTIPRTPVMGMGSLKDIKCRLRYVGTGKIVILKPVSPLLLHHIWWRTLVNGDFRRANNPRRKKNFVKKQLIMPRMNNRLTDLTIGTWNVRSLYRTGALTTVLSDLDRYRLAITAIQEVRWTGTGHLKTEKYTIFYNGGT